MLIWCCRDWISCSFLLHKLSSLLLGLNYKTNLTDEDCDTPVLSDAPALLGEFERHTGLYPFRGVEANY